MRRRYGRILNLALILMCFSVAGCGTTEGMRSVSVEIPVLVPCKTNEVAVPLWATAGLSKNDSLEVKVRALVAERRQRIGYGRELLAATYACH